LFLRNREVDYPTLNVKENFAQPTRFSTSKVNIGFMSANTRTVVLSNLNPSGIATVPLKGHHSDHTTCPSASLEIDLSQVPHFSLEWDTDLPLDEDDDINIYLNLECSEDPQHSSDSSKKHRLEEDEEHSSSYTFL